MQYNMTEYDMIWYRRMDAGETIPKWMPETIPKWMPKYDFTYAPGSSTWLTRIGSRSWFHKHPKFDWNS